MNINYNDRVIFIHLLIASYSSLNRLSIHFFSHEAFSGWKLIKFHQVRSTKCEPVTYFKRTQL